VPRILSTILAHLKIEPDIKNGLHLMKYALNHPKKFRDYRHIKSTIEIEKEPIDQKRVFFATFLGFC